MAEFMPAAPPTEPTEAAVCRLMLASYRDAMTRLENKDSWAPWDYCDMRRLRTERNALWACMEAAGWRIEPERTEAAE